MYTYNQDEPDIFIESIKVLTFELKEWKCFFGRLKG
jgi:hypothetical protein